MTQFLAASLVVVALAAIAASVYLARRVLQEFSEAERTHRLERAAIMRAVVARSGGELGMLDRIAGQAEAKRTGTVGDNEATRRISAAEFDAMLRQDFEEGLGGVGDRVPVTPEGI